MSATGQTDYDSNGEYTGATISSMGLDGEVCKEQGKDACGIRTGGTVEDGAECKAVTDCKYLHSCCNTFAKKSGVAAVSTKQVCFPAGNAITTSFAISIPNDPKFTSLKLDDGKGFPTVACPAAPVVAPVVKPAG